MDKDTIIKQLKDANDQFKRETELLKGRIKELESKLAMYSSSRCGHKRMRTKGRFSTLS